MECYLIQSWYSKFTRSTGECVNTLAYKGEVPAQATKVYRGNRCIAPLTLNLGAQFTRVANFTPRLLYEPPPPPPRKTVPSEYKGGWASKPS
jgi:hypothetical protein